MTCRFGNPSKAKKSAGQLPKMFSPENQAVAALPHSPQSGTQGCSVITGRAGVSLAIKAEACLEMIS